MQASPKNFHKKLLGRAGEITTVKYLRKKGYSILEKNYTTYFGEIDIIAKDGDSIVFIEVKTRTDADFGDPAESVTAAKCRKYYKIAEEYLMRHDMTEAPCRFDVVEICDKKIHHIENAFFM